MGQNTRKRSGRRRERDPDDRAGARQRHGGHRRRRVTLSATKSSRAAERVGVDIGGTFTDLVLLRGRAVKATAKTLTTPQDPSVGVVRGLEQLAAHGAMQPSAVDDVVHGTTLVSNALIERKGAKTALLTTRGFRDSLAMRREHRYDIYDLQIVLPEPLVPRRLRWEVGERLLADGTVDTALDPNEIRRLARAARRAHVESIAVSFLHSYRYPDHEHVAERILAAELGDIPISLSSSVMPELGEYVRTSTTVANAYVRPLIDGYLDRFADHLTRFGISAPLRLMLSTGGLASVETGRRFPVRLCESGPAAGVLSAVFFGRLAGERNVIAFDMGGTTAKACLVEAGRPLLAREHEVARIQRFAKESGLPLRVPVIDMIEIGAGGGSIAHVDQFGLPRVGPESAGAEPGPACYDLGGTLPTVTDADLVLGYLNADYFLGGEMVLNRNAAEKSLAGFGSRLGLDRKAAAAAVREVVDENMAGAARIHSIERGKDMRACTLVATGGAGPVHAWGVARRLGIKRIIYPPSAGMASALGMLTAPPSFDFARSLPTSLRQVDWAEVRSSISTMVAAGQALLGAGTEVELAADVRYRGQGDGVTVHLGRMLSRRPGTQVAEAFESSYVSLFGRKPPSVEIEILTWRVRVSGRRPSVRLTPAVPSGSALKGRRPVWSSERKAFVDARVWDRYRLGKGHTVDGPAVIEERESSVMIGIGGRGRVDEHGILQVELR